MVWMDFHISRNAWHIKIIMYYERGMILLTGLGRTCSLFVYTHSSIFLCIVGFKINMALVFVISKRYVKRKKHALFSKCFVHNSVLLCLPSINTSSWGCLLHKKQSKCACYSKAFVTVLWYALYSLFFLFSSPEH